MARAMETENFELREQLCALQEVRHDCRFRALWQVGNAYSLMGQAATSAMFPERPASPPGRPEMLYGSPSPPVTPLDRSLSGESMLESDV